ncbi:unnamed protein product [Meloidogyne enterolobii]|uniref:Uncharacterized protein n=1 Tax=Meloidogyne enterolobii TaxID=390850 RepID=A0ACB0YXC0_MELEN
MIVGSWLLLFVCRQTSYFNILLLFIVIAVKIGFFYGHFQVTTTLQILFKTSSPLSLLDHLLYPLCPHGRTSQTKGSINKRR